MRYEDTSGAFQASGPVANDDSDTLAAGSRGPATGNLITGEGTQYGSAGADSAADAHITAIAGKGGEDSSFAGGKLSIAGEFGQLSVDAQGNYSYLANKGAPENVRDRFTYTLADNQGNSDTASLIVEIGKTPVVIKADATQIVPGPDGVVTLPPGVELSDIMVVGRNLVINMPDGTQLIIVDGAVFVPQLVLGGVEVPATNVAALLIGQEPQPAAGETPPSSGGNFALPPPPLDPGVPLGDLIPPTENQYVPPEPQPTFLPEDNEPEIFVQPDGQPATVAAVDQVEEAGLPERDGDLLDEPAGSGESADGNGSDNDVNSETTTGFIIYDSPDTPNVITVNGVVITAVGQVIHGAFGDLTITSIADGQIGYSYTLLDNTSGNNTHDDFAVGLTDVDGDVANATLRIDIIDDVPTARPDTDTVGDGENPMVATGNVMTDAAPGDAGDSDTNAADTVGADNARVTFIDSVDAAPGANVPDGSFVDIAGQYGTLRIFSNGDYEYTRGPNSPGGVQDVFNYTLTDGDGDTSTTTLTINIPDQLPELPDPAAVLLDDDALANGNPGGVGDDVDSQGTPGQLVGSGGDGDLDYAFAGPNTLPSGFTTNLVNASTMQILQGGTVVLTITLDTETGAYSVVQNNPIDHPVGGDENNLSFGIGVQVVDADGDHEGATLTINVDDDTPVLSEVISQGDVTLDESNAVPGGFPISDTSVLPVIDFTAAFGADGAAAVNATVFGLAITGGPGSGLATAVGDFPITLVQIDGDTIEGHYNGSNVAFIIQMNGDGTVTLTQNVALEHLVDGPPGPAHNDALDLGGLIAATVTIKDGDGDTASGQVGIGNALVFLDDGPSVTQAHVTGLVDEDGVVEGVADGGEGDGIAGGVGDVAGQNTVATGSVASMFNSGADAPLSFDFAANTIAVLNALGLTSNGVALDYAIVGDTVTASTAAGDVFTFELNANGSWTFTLIDQLDHAPGNNENDLAINLGAIVQATDADGDFVVGNADGLVITVDDDTPTASGEQVTGLVDEDGVVEGIADGGEGDGIPGGVGDVPGAATVASGSVAAMFNSGADAPLSYGFAANAVAVLEALGLTSGGVALDYAIVGDTVTASTAAGDVFTFELNSDGSWEFTLIDQLDHAPGNNENDLAINLGAIIEATDADGDSVVGNANGLVITVDDDTPVVNPEGQSTGLVDEDGVHEGPADGGEGDGIAGGVGDVAGEATVASGSVAVMFSSGADEPLSYGFAANAIAVLNALGLTSNGLALNYAIVGDTVTASTAAGDVFTFELNANGSWEFTLIDQLDHAPGNNENDLAINLGAIIEATDADGDSVVGNANGLVITVDDDTPIATQNQVTGLVDEDGVVEGSADGGPGDGIAGGVGDVPGADTVATGSVAAMFASGADAPLSYGFAANAVAVLNALGLTSNHLALNYVINGDTVTASTAAGDVFTFELNADGSWTFTLIDQLDHASGNNENDLAINLGAIVEATDADGDSVVGNANGLVITVDDDTPTASANQVTGLVDEDGVVEGAADGGPGDGIAGGIGDVPGADTVATGSVSSMFNTGADAPLSFGFASNAITLLQGLGLTSNHIALDYALNGNTITASTAAGDVFTFQLTANGTWTFTLIDQLDHATGNNENDLTINLGNIIQATDADGDSVVGNANGLVITVDDDTPTAANDVDVIIGGNGPATGNVITGVDIGGGDANNQDGVADHTGADAPVTITAIASVNVPGNLDTDPSANFIIAGAHGTLTLNANGNYSYLRTDNVGGVQDVFTYTLTDADGDSVTATLTISIEDNFPLAGSVDVQLDDETLAGGIAGGVGDVNPDLVNVSGNLPGSLGDAPLTWSLLTTGAPAGFSYVGGGNSVQVFQGAVHVATITLTDASTGAYTVTQVDNVIHPDGLNENNVDFTVNYRVTDNDGDFADGTINVDVDDDTPTVSANLAAQLDDDALAGGNPNGTGDVNPDTANLSGTLGHAYGADGPGSTVFLTTGAPSGFTYELSGSNLLIKQGTTTVITVTLNTTSGAYTITQNNPIDHPDGLNENDVQFTLNYRVSDGDNDTVDGTLVINVDDDTPVAAIVATVQNVILDESVGIQVDSNDTTNAGVIALFNGIVSNPGTDTDLPQYAQSASAVVASTGSSVGADTPGTTVFSLNVSGAGVDSLLNTTDGHDILLFKEGNLVVGRVSGGADDGKAAFAIAIDPSTGVISTVEYLSIQHTDATNPDDSVSIANGAVLAVVTVTDGDNDSASQSLAIGGHIQFQDSGPVMTAASNINIQNSGDVAASGTFAFNLGADNGPTNDDVIKTVVGSATVNGLPVQNYTISQTSEDANTAVFTFSFDYSTGIGTAHETGTLTFNKLAGTYTVDLDNPISGITTLQTAQGTDFTGYVFNTTTVTGSQPDVAVTEITNNFFVQFTGFSMGNGSHELVTGGDTVFNNGDLFTEGGSLHQSWVSATGSSNGVAGDTVNGPDGLNFNLYSSDPQGLFTGQFGNTPTAIAQNMFLRFDGIDSGDDLVVVLKLWNDADHDGLIDAGETTTKAIVVQGSDIYLFGGSGAGSQEATTAAAVAGSPYQSIVAGIIAEGGSNNNDGLVIIESNDYNVGSENYVIVGAEILNVAGGITGTGIDLNPAVGGSGGSAGSQTIQSVIDTSPLKITNIGFLTPSTTNQNAHLTFDVTVQDGDGDTVTQTITADVTQNADSSTPISLDPGVITIQSTGGGTGGSSLSNLAYSNDNGTQNGHGYGNDKNFSFNSFNNNTGITAGIVAAAGLQSAAIAGTPTFDHSGNVDLQGLVQTVGLPAYQLQSVSGDSLNVQSFGVESSQPAFDVSMLQSSGHNFSDFAAASHGLDVQSYVNAAPAYQPNFATDQAPAFDASMLVASAAPAVGMPSAEALIAAGVAGGAQHGGSVEQILADALSNAAPTVDNLLQAVNGGGASQANAPAIEAALNSLPGGGASGDTAAILGATSPGISHVSSWDMHGAGSFGAGFDMMFKMDVAMVHHDAVQPAVNG